MTMQAKNYQPDIMYGASLSVTNITTITDVASTTGDAVSYSASAITTGNAMHVTGSGATQQTGGSVIMADCGAMTVGQGLELSCTGVFTGTAATDGIINVIANSLTSGYGIQASFTGMTTGHGLHIIGGGANMTAGGTVSYLTMGAATVGNGQVILTSGTYTGTGIQRVSGLGATTGLLHVCVATAATLTTGRYYSANDTTTGEVFGVGTNGHLISTASASVPTIGTNATGISACAITAGGSDTCGVITTTGTPQSGTVLTITFGKTYTTAPKFVALMPTNAAAGNPNTVPYVTTTATTAVITWPAAGTYAATPSYMYFVIA